MTNIAGITEGITDQIIIDNILAGFFSPNDMEVNWLQPLRDATDANRASNYGGWSQVFEYCRSDDFKQAFQFNDYIIIQIDTDVSADYGVPHQDQDGEYSPEKLIELVIEKFKSLIGEDFYGKYSEKIIFAIAVHSTECWLLPLYYTDNRKSRLVNCLNALNKELSKKEGFTIAAKNPEYYRIVSGKYCNQKTLKASHKGNPSFKIFIEEIQKRNITIEDDS